MSSDGYVDLEWVKRHSAEVAESAKKRIDQFLEEVKERKKSARTAKKSSESAETPR